MTITSQYTNQDVQNPTEGEGSFVQLPFPALRLHWYNGVPQNSMFRDTRYFGGWFSGSENVVEDLGAMGIDLLPAQFSAEALTFTARAGEQYDAYAARAVYAAPILTRDDWWEEMDNTKNPPELVKRHRTDILVYLGSAAQDKPIEPWGFATLTGKGFAGSAIIKAFRDWEKKTSEIRKKIAPNVPVMFFYVPVGTFGDKLITAPAGPSKYTPCQIVNVDWTPEFVESLYVGADIEKDMVKAQGASAEWKADTHANRSKKGDGADSAPAYMGQALPMDEEDISQDTQEPPF